MEDKLRDKIVNACNENQRGEINGTTVVSVLLAYCKEFNKPEYASQVLVQMVLSGLLPSTLFNEALDYYKIKYSITKIQKINSITGQKITLFHY